MRGLDVKLPYGLKALRLIEARFRDEMEATEHDEIEVPSLVPRDFQIVSSKLVARLKFAREKDADFSELRADDEDGDLAKEVFWVRQGGEAEEADLPSCFLRPSSELALCALLPLYIRAHSDLPFKVFQLSNTFRVETKVSETRLGGRTHAPVSNHLTSSPPSSPRSSRSLATTGSPRTRFSGRGSSRSTRATPASAPRRPPRPKSRKPWRSRAASSPTSRCPTWR